MTPYASFLYFGLTLFFVIPFVIAGLAKPKNSPRFWIVLSTIFMLIFHYWAEREDIFGISVRAIWIVLGFGLVQWVIAFLYLKAQTKHAKTWTFIGSIILSIAPLAYCKISGTFNTQPANLVGFVGISYVTFRSLDVIIGIRDRLITSLPTLRYFAFLLFFPTISSGPIDRYRSFSKDWSAERTRQQFLGDLDSAIEHIFRGFLYKFILAALINSYWLTPLESRFGTAATIEYMYAYSLYLFFDFAGYSAFAIAFSNLLGVHVLENFKGPFLAQNIKEFWNRWHISLSWWFRDHIYMRFIMAATRGRWFSSKITASNIGFILSMGLMGLWHGPVAHYIVYGLYHGCLLVGHDTFLRWNKSHGLLTGASGKWISIFITFHFVCFGLLIFSGRLF
jgi:membrane protein involved in D-alanine export